MADEKRFVFRPLSFANRDRALPGELILDTETGDVWTKDSRGNLVSSSATHKHRKEYYIPVFSGRLPASGPNDEIADIVTWTPGAWEAASWHFEATAMVSGGSGVVELYRADTGDVLQSLVFTDSRISIDRGAAMNMPADKCELAVRVRGASANVDVTLCSARIVGVVS